MIISFYVCTSSCVWVYIHTCLKFAATTQPVHLSVVRLNERAIRIGNIKMATEI